MLGDSLAGAYKKSTIYKRAEVVIDTIQQALRYQEKDKQNIMQYMNARYVEAGFINAQQKKQVLLEDWRRVMRYIDHEGRAPSFPTGATVQLHPDIPPVRVRPHVAFECGDQVEYVFYKIGKPTVTQRGNKNRFARDLQLYAAVLYGREVGFKNITASLYFLRKGSDTSNWGNNEIYFFGGGGNIVSIQDIIYSPADKEILDKKMRPIIEDYVYGLAEEQQAEETCEYCEYRDVCKYKSAPIAIETEEEEAIA